MMSAEHRNRFSNLDIETVYGRVKDFSFRDEVLTRNNLPLVLGGRNSRRVVDNRTLHGDKEKGSIIKEAVEDWLPDDLDARLHVGGEEQVLDSKEELFDAYASLVEAYEPRRQLLEGEFNEYLGGGDFEIRLENIDTVTFVQSLGSKLGRNTLELDHYPEEFGSTGDYIKDVETSEDPIMLIEGEYTHS